MNSNNEIQGYKLYPMLHFHRKFSSGVTPQLLIMCSTTKLHIYSQNVCKNYALVDTFLESQKDHYDIFFVQEPPWNFIRYASSTVSLEGDKVVGAPIHPDWTQVVRVPKDSEDIP